MTNGAQYDIIQVPNERKELINMKNTRLTKEIVIEFLASVIKWFISVGFIMWGWNTIAPHLNCPIFTYWEIFAMRMGLTWVMHILWQRKD